MRLQRLGLVPRLLLSLWTSSGCHGQHVPFANQLQPREYNGNSSHNEVANNTNPTTSSLLPLATGNRPVYLVMHVRLAGSQTFPPTYEKLFPVYATLHFNATSKDGPLEIELVNQDGQDVMRVTDWGLENADKPLGIPQPGYLTDYFELFGKSNATNDQILNASTGEGLLHDVWSQNNSLALKAYNGVDFMQACIVRLGLGLAPSDDPLAMIPSRIALAQTYWRNLWVAEKVVPHYPIWLETLKGWGSQVKKSRTEFNWRAGVNPSIGMMSSRPVPVDQPTTDSDDSLADNGISDLAAPDMTETYLASNDILRTAPQFQFIYAQPTNQQKIQQRAPPLVRDQYTVYHPGDDFPVIAQKLKDGSNDYAMKESSAPVGSGSSMDVEASAGSGVATTENSPLADDLVPPGNRETDAVIARLMQKPFVTLGRAIAGFGTMIGAVAIIITDFSKHDTPNAELCGILTILALVGGILAYLTPAGIAETVLLSSLFIGEIPDFSKSVESGNSAGGHYSYGGTPGGFGGGGRGKRAPSTPTPPLRTDVQGILQYTIVGDRNKTGNEKCLSQGYQNCTVVYGPYLLAAALQIEPFDAFALLISKNQGYPMAISDLVKAFTLATDPDSGNQVATIDCSRSTRPNDRYSWSNPNTATILTECDKPSFSINRKLVTLPILGQTADMIHNRLMPKGNCSLVGDVTGGEKFAAYNLTLTGGAVAIACGIVGAIDINGTANPLPDAPANQSTPLSLVNTGNQSSDGSSGRAYLAPPPMAPFQSTMNLTNSICMSAPDGSKLWFPNGTYSRQDGGLGFDTTKASALTLDAKSSLVITESTRARGKGVYAHAPAPPPTYIDHKVTYTTNQSATDTGFARDMQSMIKYKKYNTFTVNVPIEPDAACFYQQPLGMGDFACFGPGGGDLPPGLKGNTRSVKAYGRASVEIFANSYGNSFAHIIDTFEEDLSQLPYDEKSSFADVASSIWIYLEPGERIPTMGGPPEASASTPAPPGPTLKSQRRH